jgi:hypothetical protein
MSAYQFQEFKKMPYTTKKQGLQVITLLKRETA